MANPKPVGEIASKLELTSEQKKQAGIIEIHGRDYQTVAKRLKDMKEDHPDYSIKTKILHSDETTVLMRALILNGEGKEVARGHAEENRSLSQINKTSAVENAETSAVGRALSLLGYLGTEIRSAEEMVNAIHQQSVSETISKYFISRLVDEIDNCFEVVKGDRGQDQAVCHDEKELKKILSVCNEIKDDDHELKRRVWRELPSLIRSYISDMEKG